MKEKLGGSFKAKVITKIFIPVLATTEKYKFKLPKKIAHASNYNGEDRIVLQSLLELNQLCNVKNNTIQVYSGISFITTGEDSGKYKNNK